MCAGPRAEEGEEVLASGVRRRSCRILPDDPSGNAIELFEPAIGRDWQEQVNRPGSTQASVRNGRGSAGEVFLVFLKLGLTSFGGPIAHLGYFRDAFVVRRRWLDEHAFADLVGLCQFLPGPASSQVGFSIGLMRAGFLGALAAWTAFTLPSAILLVLVARGVGALDSVAGAGLLHGLKLVAVAIVAQAIWGMARTLCPDRERASIAAGAALIVLYSSSSLGQIAALAAGALLGLWLCRSNQSGESGGELNVPVSRRLGIAALAAFFSLLVGLPLMRGLGMSRDIAFFEAFYRSGALVFGGGHVVLPLLREAFAAPGWVTDDAFLAGYGAAQAVPGPLFSFAAYLGAIANPSSCLASAGLGLIGLFLPGMLILVGALPFWNTLRRRARARALMAGINAAVVGILAAAFYNPVWTSAVSAPADFGLALIGFVLLTVWRAPPLVVVIVTALGGVALA